MAHTVLFVDDHGHTFSALKECLQEVVLVIETNASRGFRKALELHHKRRLDLVLLDIILPAGDEMRSETDGRDAGLRIAEKLRDHGVTVPIVFWTVDDAPEARIRAEAIENCSFFNKVPARTIAELIRDRL